MKIFGKFLKINILEEMQYKATFISGIICQFAFGFMYLFLYIAFFENGVPQNFNQSQMASYIWLGQAFFAMFNYGDLCKKEISQPIMTGNVSYQLLKPINIYDHWYWQTLAKAVAKMLLRFFPIVLVASLLPSGFNLSLPASWGHFGVFALSLVLGCMLMAAVKMIIYTISAYALDAKGVFAICYAIFGFLGGSLIPLPMLPVSIQKVLNFFPFRYISDLPYRVYIGNLTIKESLIQTAIQAAWLVVLVVVCRIILTRKSRKMIVQGG